MVFVSHSDQAAYPLSKSTDSRCSQGKDQKERRTSRMLRIINGMKKLKHNYHVKPNAKSLESFHRMTVKRDLDATS